MAEDYTRLPGFLACAAGILRVMFGSTELMFDWRVAVVISMGLVCATTGAHWGK